MDLFFLGLILGFCAGFLVAVAVVCLYNLVNHPFEV